jgi:phage virion morphogenesis protein
MIEGSIDTTQVLKAFQNLVDNVDNPSPALREIGEVLVQSTKQRFVSKTDPDGTAWKDNSAITIANKGRNEPLIGESGELGEQIHYNLVGSGELEVGSSMEYAAMQHFGGLKSDFPHLWGDIPARRIVGISSSDEKQIIDIVGDHILGNF